MKWYEKSAAQGNADAHYHIAEHFYKQATKGDGKRTTLALVAAAILPGANIVTMPIAAGASAVAGMKKMIEYVQTEDGKKMVQHYKAAADLGHADAKKRYESLKAYL